MGKGDKRRPMQVTNKEYSERWAAIWADEKPVCKVCGGELKDGICQKLLDQQTRNNK